MPDPRPEPGPSAGNTPVPACPLDLPDTLALLTQGRLTVEGRLVDASNATLLAVAALDGVEAVCVYKPVAGERPLWDFPDGTLAARERSAYLVAEASGWHLVPPTVLREGPFGPGMCQLWVEADATVDLVDILPRGRLPRGWLRVLDAIGGGGAPVTLAHADDTRLRRMAVLDAVINNADRKAGHVLPVPAPVPGTPVALGPHLYGVDHGVCFNVDDKLRSVLWGWAGRRLTDEALEVLRRLRSDLDDGELGRELRNLLSASEVAHTLHRVERLLHHCAHPMPVEGWPTIPWPPF